ncbi:GAP family protein [Leifsonia lichenia]
MTQVLGDLIPYAIAVSTSPLPLIAVLLLFRSPHARAASAAFLISRFLVVAVVAGAVAFAAEFLPQFDDSSLLLAALRILGGLALMVWAIVKVLKRPRRGDDVDMPGWMASIENATVPSAARLGVLLSAANLKEIAFGFGAGLTIASADLAVGPTILIAVLYALVACLALIVVVVAFLVAEQRVRGPLDSARGWLVRNNSVLIAGVLLIIGAILVGEGVSSL